MSDSADSDCDGLANIVGVGDKAIGGVDLATSAQHFFQMIYYRTEGNVGGVGDADNGRPFRKLTGPTPWAWPRRCFRDRG